MSLAQMEPFLIFQVFTASSARSWTRTSPSAISPEKTVFAAYAPPVPIAIVSASSEQTLAKDRFLRNRRSICEHVPRDRPTSSIDRQLGRHYSHRRKREAY